MTNVHTLTVVKEQEREALRKRHQQIGNEYLASAQLNIDEDVKRMVISSSSANSESVEQAFDMADSLTPMVAKAVVPALAAHVKILQIGIESVVNAAQETANELEIVSSQKTELQSKLEAYESPDDVACMLEQIRQAKEQLQRQAPKQSQTRTTKLWLERGLRKYLEK